MKRNWIAIQNEDFHRLVDGHLLKVKDTFDDNNIYNTLSALIVNGKRVRAELIYALANRDSQNQIDNLALDAAIIELIHLSTLIHDDIIDRSQIRRGASTLNSIYSDEIALLVGNIIKDKALIIAPNSSKEIFNEASFDVNRGQLLETIATEYPVLSAIDYFKVVLFKSVMMFIHCARIANNYRKNSIRENEFRGLALLAFSYQIVDDWIDMTKTEMFAGKNTGLDMANKVKSFFSSSPGGKDNIRLSQLGDIHRKILEDMWHVYTEIIPSSLLSDNSINVNLLHVDEYLINRFLKRLRETSLALINDPDIKDMVVRFFNYLESDIKNSE